MMLLGRVGGVDIYADTDDPQRFFMLEELFGRALAPDSRWDFHKDKDHGGGGFFVEREPAERE